MDLIGLKSLYVFDHLTNGKEWENLIQKKILMMSREKDRKAKLIIRMEGNSTFLTDPRLTRKFIPLRLFQVT